MSKLGIGSIMHKY